MEGNIIVDGVLASCYASSDHDLVHIIMVPIQRFPWDYRVDLWQGKGNFNLCLCARGSWKMAFTICQLLINVKRKQPSQSYVYFKLFAMITITMYFT